MKKVSIFLLFIFLILSLFNSCINKEHANANNLNYELEHKVDSILSLMSIDEKIGQLNQYSVGEEMTGPNQKNEYSKKRFSQLINGHVGSVLNLTGAKNTKLLQKQVIENTRLKIPLLFAYDVIHGYKTIFPIPLAESCSWDLELIEKTAQAAAYETAASGINWTFAPMIDVSRDPRWGRVMEGGGEDPFLGAKIAVARINGFQGNSLKDTLTIAACAKHFAGYGFVESGKDYNTVDISNNTLMNIVLTPFEKAAKNNVATFMTAFNDINGIPASANPFLLKNLLRETWEYSGVVVSDWGSIGEMINHKYSENLKTAAKQAILSGTDIDMESEAYINWLKKVSKEDPLIINAIDNSVKRVLLLKYKLGLFDDPYKYSDTNRERKIVGNEHIKKLAKDAAIKSIVLLKNNSSLLPISLDKKVGLIGPLANDKDSPLGNWRAKAKSNSAISLYEGLKKFFDNSMLQYEKGCDLSIGNNNFFEELKINENDTSGFNGAIRLAKSCDVVVIALGEPAFMSGEGRSRSKIGLPGIQLSLLKEIYKVNKNIVLVLMNGRPLTISWEAEYIPSILETWHCGTMAGDAIAEVLVGKHNPSGKLTMSFPKNIGQIPIFYNQKNTGRPSAAPNQVFYTHYSDVDNEPLYPFGHGISYTNFSYSGLKISKHKIYADDTLIVSVNIANIGEISGDEIVQLYVSDNFASATPANKLLKGFEKIHLNPAETKTVEFLITKDHLGFYNYKNEFVLEPGSFKIGVGTNSIELDTISFQLIQ